VGPFEEEEEGVDVVSEVVKVKGEDPVTQYLEGGQGEEVRQRSICEYVLLAPSLRKPRDRKDS